MRDFRGKIAVVTGAGTGMGRELVCQLASEGCHVAFCELIVENMKETKRLCDEIALPGTRITAHECDVSDEAQVIAFRDAVMAEHATEHINLLFNNAGVAGGGSFVLTDREEWDRTFAVDWFGVYYSTRAFMPMLLASEEGCIVNTSSVEGFWACLGPLIPQSAYPAAKFAVKGFTEGLQVDLRLNAPHVKAFLVMPGHVGTSIGINANRILGKPEPDAMSEEDLQPVRQLLGEQGVPADTTSDDQIRDMLKQQGEAFRDTAPLTSADAATVILDGIRNDRWRILVGDDAHALDEMVRTHPEEVYEPSFMMQAQAADGDNLWTAAKNGDSQAIIRHLSAGEDPDAEDPNLGGTALHVSAVFGQVEAARLLIERGAAIDATNREGATALHLSAFLGQTEMVKLLLEKGAGTDARNQRSETPFDMVAAPWSPELEGLYRIVEGVLPITLDLEKIEVSRPVIADLIRQHIA